MIHLSRGQFLLSLYLKLMICWVVFHVFIVLVVVVVVVVVLVSLERVYSISGPRRQSTEMTFTLFIPPLFSFCVYVLDLLNAVVCNVMVLYL